MESREPDAEQAAGSESSKDGPGGQWTFGRTQMPEVPVALPVVRRTALAAGSPENGPFLLLDAFPKVPEQGEPCRGQRPGAGAELQWEQLSLLAPGPGSSHVPLLLLP